MFRTIKSVRIPNRNTIRYLSVKSITFAEKGTQEYKIRNVYIQKGQIVGVNDPIADFLSPVDILELKASFRGEIVDVHCKVGDGVHVLKFISNFPVWSKDLRHSSGQRCSWRARETSSADLVFDNLGNIPFDCWNVWRNPLVRWKRGCD